MSKTYLLNSPDVGKAEKEYLIKAIDMGYVSAIGPFVSKFEEKFAKYVHSNKAVALQSGTAALHMSLYELGVGRGDEIIVPCLTYVATVNAVLYTCAKPKIVDVDLDTWMIEPGRIRKAITPRTKAIIPVHLYGNCCNMHEITKIAREYNLYVVEDSTESLAGMFRGRQVGTFGHFGCFSFNGNKLITTGGGGIIVSEEEERIKHIKFLINQATDPRRDYYHPEMGFNYSMTNIEAALGLAQLERIDEFLRKKRKIKEIYKEILGILPYVKFQKDGKGVSGSNWLTCIKIEIDRIDIDRLIKILRNHDIETRRIFTPICEMPYLSEPRDRYPNSYDIYKKAICLPSSTVNGEDDIKKAALKIRGILEKKIDSLS